MDGEITWYRVTKCLNCGETLKNIQHGTEGYFVHPDDSIYCKDGSKQRINEIDVVDYKTAENYKSQHGK